MKTKVKRRRLRLSDSIALASLVVSATSLIWIGGFRMSTLMHEVGDLKDRVDNLEIRMERGFDAVDKRFEKIENRLENMQRDLHQMDVRVTTVEQRKP